MLLLDLNEGAEAIENELEIFREALFILSNPRALECLKGISYDYLNSAFNGKIVHLNLLASNPEALDFANTVLNYLGSRDFFFKEKSRFAALCGELNMEAEDIRSQLREEELRALTDGGLDEVNLYQMRDTLGSVVCKIDNSR